MPKNLHRYLASLACAVLLVVAGAAHGAEPTKTPTTTPTSTPDEALPTDEGPPAYTAADPSAPELTAKTLFANERFWPYKVDLTAAWTAPDGQKIAAGTRGILIHMIDAARARIDFGRHGVGDVLVAKTDLLARANQVRLGTEVKHLPNFVEAMGPRLMASSVFPPRPFPVSAVFARKAFLAVFADPTAADFDALAAALAPLRDRPELLTILLPQGRPPDAVVYERLRALGWKVPFVFRHLAEPYTASLVGPSPTLPLLTLQTADGRLLLSETWKPANAASIRTRIDEGLSTIGIGSTTNP
jgi:hypothetical protein